MKDLRDRDGLSRIYTAAEFRDTDNIGLQLVSARDTKRPNKLVAVDFDARELIPRGIWAFMPHTCGWGRESKPISQILYRCEVDKSVVLKDLGDGSTLIEIRASHQSMCPPSAHPNGEKVTWISGSTREGESVPDLTSNELDSKNLRRRVNLVATLALMIRYYRDRGARHYWGLYLAGLLEKLGLSEEETSKLFELAGEARSDPEVKDRLDAVHTTFARPDDDPVAGSKALIEEMGDAGKPFVDSLRKIWGASATGFEVNDQGRIIASSLRNCELAVEKLDVRMSHDGFRDRSLMSRNGNCAPMEDAAIVNVWLEVERQWSFRPSKDFFIDVLSDLARRKSFHPVRDYLDALKWDGKKRIDEWLIKYGRASDTAFVRAVSRITLIAACRRVRQPGCKFDELLVLESAQGLNKSSALRRLCPNEAWFGEDLPLGLDAKQMIERTAGRWIIEIAELVGSRKDAEHLKASLSRQVDGPVRMAYARLPIEVPRQFVLIGTTNPSSYLRDMTGNRRFWPVQVGLFDVEGIGAVRDQLWAEASHREAKSETIRLDPALYDAATNEQEERRERDPWENTIQEFIETMPVRATREGKPVRRVKSKDIWDRLGFSLDRWDPQTGARISAVMRRLGFKAIKVREGKTVFAGWQLEAPGELPAFGPDYKP